MRIPQWILFLLALVCLFPLARSTASGACPCDDLRWCTTIDGPPVRPSGEIYGFYGSWVHANNLTLGRDINWTHVTTVAWVDKDEVMCLAHRHGARAVMASPQIHNLTDMATNHTARKIWMQQALDQVLRTYRDGIVFDYENPLPSGSREGKAYAKLIAETRQIFHQVNPSLQITTCVPWSPNNIDGRAYPYKELAQASDLLYVMDYDTRSQIYGDCIAGANAPLDGMKRGMTEWLKLGIPPKKLVLGVPWYGYKYACLPGTHPDSIICPIKPVPFRGVNCSDAAGSQVAHADAIRMIRKTNATVRRDRESQCLFFNTVERSNSGDGGNSRTSSRTSDDDVVYQYWIEDTTLLQQKYRWAQEQGLAGVGPYMYQNLDPIRQPKESAAMWSAFDWFLFKEDAVLLPSSEELAADSV